MKSSKLYVSFASPKAFYVFVNGLGSGVYTTGGGGGGGTKGLSGDAGGSACFSIWM